MLLLHGISRYCGIFLFFVRQKILNGYVAPQDRLCGIAVVQYVSKPYIVCMGHSLNLT